MEGAAPRRPLVLCFDGTDGEFRTKNSNVVKFFELLDVANQDNQLCYYQSGIGTYTNPGIVSPINKFFATMADLAVAWYLDHHVMGGYQFLMQNYREGDKICLFGFSRGAYTARALAAMLCRVGLLPKDNKEQVTFAYKTFARTGKTADKAAANFKRAFSRSVFIDFVGCWDTVASTGALYSKTLPFSSSTNEIKIFRHALALDEHRSRFLPNTWHKTAPSKEAVAMDPQHSSSIAGEKNAENTISQQSKDGVMPISPDPTDVLEVWFTGCHTDIGGGNWSDDDTKTLSNITFRWMVREVIKVQTGIIFDSAAMARAGLETQVISPLSYIGSKQDTLAGEEGKPMALSSERTKEGSELPTLQTLDERDANSRITDDLKTKPYWWLLEIVPFRHSWQDSKGVWHRGWRPNFGRGRQVHDSKPNIYVTVKHRINDPKLSYKPRAKWHSEPNWIEL